MRRRATSAALVLAGALALMAGAAQATDGIGTMAVAPTCVVAGSGGNTFTFMYTAAENLTSGQLELTVPTGWTAPQNTDPATAGYVTTTAAGALSISGQTITVSSLILATGNTADIVYGSTAGNAGGAVTAPAATGSSTFTAGEAGDGGTLTLLATSPAVTVAPTGVKNFLVAGTGGGAIGTQTAGQSFDIKVTAHNQCGNTDTDFGGTVDVSSNRTCLAGCVTSAAFSSGVLASHAVTLTQAGSGATVTVTQSGGTESGTSNQFTVLPGAADHLSLTGSTADLTAGSPRTLTAAIDDAFGNTVDSTASVTFAQTAGTGTVSGLGSVSASGGVAGKEVTGLKAGLVTIQASSSGIVAATITFTVVPGAADHLTLAGQSTDLVAGTSRTLTAQIEDAFENTVDSSASVTFAKAGGNGTVTGLGTTAASQGAADRQVTGDKAGPITIRASSSGVTAATISFRVVPGAAKRLAFTMWKSKSKLGVDMLLAVEIRDSHGNRVLSPARPVTLSRASGSGRVAGLGKVRSLGGVAWALVTGLKTGKVKLKATVPGLTTATIKLKIVK